jgi:hypothetical protein
MSLYCAQDQLVARSPVAKPAMGTWCTCVLARGASRGFGGAAPIVTSTPVKGEGTREISKQFAHRGGRPSKLSNLGARLAARLGNPEDRP